MTRRYAKLGFLFLLLVLAAAAWAKSVETIEAPYDHLFSISVRFLRVDKGWEIVEKDKENGYILFKFKPLRATQAMRGSLELIRLPKSKEEGAEKTPDCCQVALILQGSSEAQEQVLLEELKVKVRDEMR